jgi:hypothetical protein
MTDAKPKLERTARDPEIMNSFMNIVYRESKNGGGPDRRSLTFLTLWNHGPLSYDDVNRAGECNILHQYLNGLEVSGWIHKSGKIETGNEKGRAHKALWDITGKVGIKASRTKSKSIKSSESFRNVTKTNDIAGRKMWPEMVAMIQAYYTTKMAGSGDLSIAKMASDIKVEVDILRETLNSKAGSLLCSSGDSPTRRNLIKALSVLGISPPRPGQSIKLEEARKSMRRLARAYHPDVNPNGSEQFHKVIDAFTTIERFVETSKSP